MRGSRLHLVALAFVLAIALLVGACGGSSASSSGAADIEFLEPGDFAIADYAGKPLVINFFGSWCGPCKLEAPDLARFLAANPDVQFVGVAESDKKEDVAGFMQEFGLDFPVVMDDGHVGQAQSITGVPTTIFFDSMGREADRIIGVADLQRFEEGLAKAQ
jgi:cytochrome c biogenesis protein CcmG/thiol:disulfide interchange protein DsbE